MKYKFEELIESISDTRKINKSEVILINTSDVENGAVLNHKYVKNQNLRGQFKKRFKKGDILYSEIRPKNKRFAYINFDSEDYIASTKLMVLRKKSALIDNDYLFYLLKSDSMINKLQMLAESRSGTFPQITFDELKRIEVEVPELEQQRKIIKILVSLDKKIELNNQINDNLLDVLKLKFNNWINNLDEYTISNLSSIANYKNGLAMQKYRPINEEGLPVIKIKEMNSGLSSETERCSSNIDEDVIINDGDVLFAWSGTLCMTIWCNGKAGLNQHIFKVTSEKYPKWFYYFWTMKHLDKFIQIAAGKATTMGHIKRNELDLSEVLLPNEEEMQKMDKIMKPLLEKYIENLKENKQLEQLRDTLLPKLMNGEIDLDKIEG